MATGQILRGRSNMPLFGKNGTLLYSTVVSMQVDITISWGGGQDVDICGCYNTVPGEVGWNHADEIDQDGFLPIGMVTTRPAGLSTSTSSIAAGAPPSWGCALTSIRIGTVSAARKARIRVTVDHAR